jgi:hypothetical protein
MSSLRIAFGLVTAIAVIYGAAGWVRVFASRGTNAVAIRQSAIATAFACGSLVAHLVLTAVDMSGR